MNEQMFCFQCEQTAGCRACMGRAGVCGKPAPVAEAQDRLTGAMIVLAQAAGSEGRHGCAGDGSPGARPLHHRHERELQ